MAAAIERLAYGGPAGRGAAVEIEGLQDDLREAVRDRHVLALVVSGIAGDNSLAEAAEAATHRGLQL